MDELERYANRLSTCDSDEEDSNLWHDHRHNLEVELRTRSNRFAASRICVTPALLIALGELIKIYRFAAPDLGPDNGKIMYPSKYLI